MSTCSCSKVTRDPGSGTVSHPQQHVWLLASFFCVFTDAEDVRSWSLKVSARVCPLKHLFQVGQSVLLPQRVEAAWPRGAHSTAGGFQHQSGNPGRGAGPGVFVWWHNTSGAVQLLVTSGVANNPGAGGRRPQWKPVPRGLLILWALKTEILT